MTHEIQDTTNTTLKHLYNLWIDNLISNDNGIYYKSINCWIILYKCLITCVCAFMVERSVDHLDPDGASGLNKSV